MLHTLAERLQLAGRGNTQASQGPGHALFKDGFQPTPLLACLGAQTAGQFGDALSGLGHALLGDRLGLALQIDPVLHQGFEDLTAFLLGLGKSSEAGQPDLLGRFTHKIGGFGGRVVLLFACHGFLLLGATVSLCCTFDPDPGRFHSVFVPKRQ